MYIGMIALKVNLTSAQSLKDKRSLARSFTGKLRNKFNLSVAETDYLDLPQTLGLGISWVSNEYAQAEKIAARISAFSEEFFLAEILESEQEIFRW